MLRKIYICDGRRCIRQRSSCNMQHESGNGQRCCTRQDHHATTKAGRQSLRPRSQRCTRVLIRVQRSMRRRACNAAAQHGPADSNRTALPCLLLAMDLERPFTTAAPSGAFGSFVFSGECAGAAEARGPPACAAAALRHLRRPRANQRHICTRTRTARSAVCAHSCGGSAIGSFALAGVAMLQLERELASLHARMVTIAAARIAATLERPDRLAAACTIGGCDAVSREHAHSLAHAPPRDAHSRTFARAFAHRCR
jgi:hypothetical protein